jgi:hypothetical protein
MVGGGQAIIVDIRGYSPIQRQHTHLMMAIEPKIIAVTAQNSRCNDDLPNALKWYISFIANCSKKTSGYSAKIVGGENSK